MAAVGVIRRGAPAGVYRAISERLSLQVAAQTFYRNLTGTVASLTRARRVIFLELTDGYLGGVRDAFGFAGSEVANLALACAAAKGRGGVERTVYDGHALNERHPRSAGSTRALMEALSASDVAAVPWRHGERPLGLLAACDSSVGGFNEDDLSILEAAGMGAAIAWEHHRTVASLKAEHAEIGTRISSEAAWLRRENEVTLDLLAATTSEMRAALRGTDAPERLTILASRLDDVAMLVAGLPEPAHRTGQRLRLAHERLGLDDVVADVCTMVRMLLVPRCDIVQNVSPRAIVWGDRRALTTVLVTLLNAALRNGRPGSLVEVKGRAGRGSVHLGIRVEWAPGYREGMALLDDVVAHCRLLARMHGGELVVDVAGPVDFPLVLSLPLAECDRGNLPAAPMEAFEVLGTAWIRVDDDHQVVERNGRRIRLSWTEWRLFAFLWGHPNTVFTRVELAAGAWGDGSASRAQVVDINISRIRSKIERDAKRPSLICTVRGRGYALRTRAVGGLTDG